MHDLWLVAVGGVCSILLSGVFLLMFDLRASRFLARIAFLQCFLATLARLIEFRVLSLFVSSD